MAKKKIIVACGGAVATSTVAADAVRDLCKANGIDADVQHSLRQRHGFPHRHQQRGDRTEDFGHSQEVKTIKLPPTTAGGSANVWVAR